MKMNYNYLVHGKWISQKLPRLTPVTCLEIGWCPSWRNLVSMFITYSTLVRVDFQEKIFTICERPK